MKKRDLYIIVAVGLLLVLFWGYFLWSTPNRLFPSVAENTSRQEDLLVGETSSESAAPSLENLEDLERENRERLSQGCFTGRDCIPSLDNPQFISASAAASFLNDDDWVIGLFRNDEARAYPLKILNWHEIVNDKVGDEYIAISFCPLCFTGNAFERVIDGEPVEFGVSGFLMNSNLVMYDRKTESLWQQLTGEALTGSKTGEKLKKITVSTLPWSDWKQEHPDTAVLSLETGFERDYQLFPYGNYNTSDDVFFPIEHTDDRLFEKELTYGVRLYDKAKAYPLVALNEKLPEGGEFEDDIGGHPVRVTWNGGSFRIFDTVADEEIVPEIGFWFSWVAFYPDTEIYE